MKRYIKIGEQVVGRDATKIIKDYSMSFYDMLLKAEGGATEYFKAHFYPKEQHSVIIRKQGIFKVHLATQKYDYRLDMYLNEDDDEDILFKIANTESLSKSEVLNILRDC